MTKIKVELRPSFAGAFLAVPVAAKARRAYAEHMKLMTGSYDPSAFFQGDYDLPDVVRNNRRVMRELRAGFTAAMLVDPWEYGHWLGWDACHVTWRAS